MSTNMTTDRGRVVQNSHRSYYNTPSVVNLYRDIIRLSPSEELILATLQQHLKDQPILDLGIGAGRTTPYLRKFSSNYVGIDLSEIMIDSAREKFPEARLLQGNAADLSIFGAVEFAAVFFLGAGIDEASLADRPTILREIYRVLQPGGVFVLCVHNLRARETSPWSDFEYSSSRNPGVFFRDSLRFLSAYCATAVKLLWSRATKKQQIVLTEYEDHHGQHPGEWLSTCYMRCAAQMQQLREAGFCDVEARDRNGHPTDGNAGADNFLYYLAYKEQRVL